MSGNDWRLLGKALAGAFGFGACLYGLGGTLMLLWLEGLEGGDI